MFRSVDLDLNFTRNPITSDVSLLIQNNAVKRSLRNLVFFNFLEKPFGRFLCYSVKASYFYSSIKKKIQKNSKFLIKNENG